MTIETVGLFLLNHLLEILLFVAAVLLIPYRIRKKQEKDRRRLTENLLMTWIDYCADAINRLKPDDIGEIEVQEYWPETKTSPHGPLGIFEIASQMQRGHIDPSGFNYAVWETLNQLIKKDEYSVEYIPHEPEVVKARLRVILNQFYAKVDLFDVSIIHVMSLELALCDLEESIRTGSFSLKRFHSFTMHTVDSMEQFARMLWRLKGWQMSKSYRKVLSV